MAIKNILIAYNGGQSSRSALSVALMMQQKYDAHVTGLFAHGISRLMNSIHPGAMALVRRTVQDAERRTHEEIRGRFDADVAAAREQYGDKIHYSSADREADAAIIEQARYFDITVMGALDVKAGEEHVAPHPDRIALTSGRPVLIVPKDYSLEQFNETAVLAWDGKRAAARALSDAMQILETKQLVTVVTVGDVPGATPDQTAGLTRHLERHGVKTRWQTLKPVKGSISAAITTYCQAVKPGLLVMGAYEHSKFKEDFFGGVTDEIMKTAETLVLMSH